MEFEFHEDSSSEEKDIKPVLQPKQEPNPVPKKWSPVLQDANRKSAFLPYRQMGCTVLTNLQRGNTQAETQVPEQGEVNFHTKAGQGELVEQDVRNERDVDVKDGDGLTALHWASGYGQMNAVQLLLQHGAQVDILGPEEESALTLAASGGHHDILQLLIEKGADVNHVDHLCNTPLMYAARGNHPHCCQELLMHGANFKLHNLNGDTAHTIAVENNSTLAQAVITNFIISQLEPN